MIIFVDDKKKILVMTGAGISTGTIVNYLQASYRGFIS